MTKPADRFSPPPLTAHFDPPEGFVGQFGWLCGFSADADFLNDATARFLGQSARQRAHIGRVGLAVMLDPGNPRLDFTEVPGVLHLPMKAPDKRPFLLLHAKVALLAFAASEKKSGFVLRLLVSTGNWTRQTVEESLDLVWRSEVSSDQLTRPDESVRATCGDIRAAWEMMEWLRRLFDTRALEASPTGRVETETTVALSQLAQWIDAASEHADKRRGSSRRFIDNRRQSIADQLVEGLRTNDSLPVTNRIAMGSGYFESTPPRGAIPGVLSALLTRLKATKRVTARPEVDVVVNPQACQSIAASTAAFKKDTSARWTLRPPGVPAYFGAKSIRTLHAKFVFGARRSARSPQCEGAWVCFGSANLTKPGFLTPAGRLGNLEANVLLFPEGLHWDAGPGAEPAKVLSNLLPIRWDETRPLDLKLEAGDSEPEREVGHRAAPVAWFAWLPGTKNGYLISPRDDETMVEVLGDDGQECRRDRKKRFIWLGKRPRMVKVRWSEGEESFESLVPVIDEYGRLAAGDLPPLELDAAWGLLANFPQPPDDEDLEDLETDQTVARPPGHDTTPPRGPSARYPIRSMMQLIENVASRQTQVFEREWSNWCMRLEQALIQAAEDPAVIEFRKLALNPLAPLVNAAFRPDFAESDATEAGQRYEAALDRVAKAWKVHDLDGLGGSR